ncbi:MAG: hypothetical protein K5981_08370, partial [Clostridia bacterium]|nr:hypothetical protein [Clostridia bacterium]
SKSGIFTFMERRDQTVQTDSIDTFMERAATQCKHTTQTYYGTLCLRGSDTYADTYNDEIGKAKPRKACNSKPCGVCVIVVALLNEGSS